MKKQHFIKLLLSLLFIVSAINSSAQRKSENLDRGVVAVRNSSNLYFVSWRFFATDPDDIKFNLYVKKLPALPAVKLNSSPLSVPNYQTASGAVMDGSQLYVTSIVNGVESAPSSIFTVSYTGFKQYRSAYLDISYNPANDNLDLSKYSTKFSWPADLDGDGEYDFVVDRLSVDGANSHKIQGYLRNGTLLWTVDMGPNVSICQGQDDMVISYDMDGDGKAEVVIKSSDGTQFADGKGVNGSTTLDTDNDGIVNYDIQNTKNPPQYITVIDGMTGVEKNSIEMKYPSNYTRTNKAIFMGSEYSNLNGHMAILYLDGKHPSVGFIYKTRTSADQYHWYYASAYGYNTAGQWVNWYNWERGKLDAAECHGIRVADVDLDGRDELLDLGYGIKYDGTLAFNAHISHGDRFRVGDVDPERPGLETYAIQQNASSMLGQLLYEAPTGTAIKKWFLSAMGDVGRGECMDIDSTHTGYEMYSTMPNIYNAKGNVIYEGATPFPNEGVWWDGDLAREELTSSDGSGFNADIRKYDINTHDFGNRLIEFAKMTGWQVKSEWGRRPAFFGDIAGDWREEVVLEKKGTASITLKDVNGNDSIGTVETCPGFVGFSTDYPTSQRIYCLMQNPAYRMQATTRGYYQSAFPDFYLGYKMPTPPISPIQKAKLTWSSGSTFDKSTANFVLADEKSISTFNDGDDVMFDISGANNTPIQLSTDLSPSKIWAINPLGHDFVLAGSGKLTGSMELVKSLNGTFTLNGNHTFTGNTTIHEGTVNVNGSLASPIIVLAKGTLSGNAIINGGITLNPGLNIEGGRLSPGNGLASGKLGKMVINNPVVMNGKVNLLFDILPSDSYKNDSLVINGNLTLAGVNNIVINTESGVLPAGSYSLMQWTGSLTGSLANFTIAGISGLPMSLVIENNTLKLVVNSTRSAGTVTWTGKESGNWDYLSANFKLSGSPTFFVNGDSVLFDDNATLKTITLNDNFTTSRTTFTNTTSYVLKGTGGITGSGDFTKNGNGLLDIQTANNSYTGKTVLNNAVVQVAALADGGANSSFGATTADAGNFVLNNSRLIVNSATTNTNRVVTLIGADTINVPKSNGVVSFTGLIAGTGRLVKNGPGQLNLSGNIANTYTGGTLLNGSTLGLGSLTMNSNGLGSGLITLENGGKIAMFYNTSDYNQKPTWNILVSSGQTGALVASGRCLISGSLTGAGTFNFTVPYVRADYQLNSASFTGTVAVAADADGGTFRIMSGINFPLATIQLANLVDMGTYAAGASGTTNSISVSIGALSGVAGSSVSGGNYTIGGNNKDATFAGTIKSGATITKTGTGNWTLSGANTNTTSVNVNQGKLTVTNTSGSATGTGTVIVNNTAMLAGTGIISGAVTLNSGSTLSPGNAAIGTLNLGSSLTLLTGSKLSIEASGSSSDKVAVTGAIALSGTLEMVNKGVAYQAGKSFTIFSAGSVSGAFSDISPATPAAGLKWNTTRINEGIISIDIADGIEDITGANIRVFPSLVDNHCTVELGSLSGEVKIELIDRIGSVVLSDRTSSSQNYVFNLSQLTPGYYFIRITNANNQSFIRKVIKR